MSMESSYFLTAIEPLPRDHWASLASSAAKSCGYTIHQSSSQVLAWKAIRSTRAFQYADGWVIRRLWLGPGRWAMSLTTKRVYFHNGSEDLDTRPEYEIVGGHRPQSPSAGQLAVEACDFLKMLCRTTEFNGCSLVPLEKLNADLRSARTIRIGNAVIPWESGSLNTAYKTNGFDSYPELLSVSVCPVDGVSDQVAHQWAMKLEAGFKARKVSGSVRCVHQHFLEARLEKMRSEDITPAMGKTVVFILPTKPEQPSKELMALMHDLESLKVPFRRAYSDDPFDFSIPDQLPSIILACGGMPHQTIQLDSHPDLWCIGLDLSHRKDRSVIALTLTDPKGKLCGIWTTQQPKDETIQAASLKRLLAPCRQALLQQGDPDEIVVLRDGRLFSHENSEIYTSSLDARVSLYEYRKRNNPFVVVEEDASYKVARCPAGFRVPGTNLIFLATAPPRKITELPKFGKIVSKDNWNQLALSHEDTAYYLTALSTAPGLGLHPKHLPSPIYWADGVAGASDTDLRFRGQICVRI